MLRLTSVQLGGVSIAEKEPVFDGYLFLRILFMVFGVVY